MILYRALNEEDLKSLYLDGMITSSLINSYENRTNASKEVQKKLTEFYKKCYEELDEPFLLSLIYGHINGKLVNAKRSPWISTTSDFFTAYNYATLNKCAGDGLKRRSILCFEIDDNQIINTISELKNKSLENGTALNLANNRLANYRKDNLILPYETKCKIKEKGLNFSISNYATADSMYLIVNSIKLGNYLLLDPLQQDLLIHQYGNDVTNYIEKIVKSLEYKEEVVTSSLQFYKKMI